MKMRVVIRPKREVPDTGGELVQSRLVEMGYSEVRKVVLGKFLELELEIGDADMAAERVQRMCNELLVNGVVEEFDLLPEE